MDFTLIALVTLGTARLTRLVTQDKVTEPFRLWAVNRWGTESWRAYLLHCPWCISIYTGAGTVLAAQQWADQRWFSLALLALSASYVTGYLESRTED